MGKPLRTIDPPCAIVIEAPFRSALQTPPLAIELADLDRQLDEIEQS
jgi:hypothetical protein